MTLVPEYRPDGGYWKRSNISAEVEEMGLAEAILRTIRKGSNPTNRQNEYRLVESDTEKVMWQGQYPFEQAPSVSNLRPARRFGVNKPFTVLSA